MANKSTKKTAKKITPPSDTTYNIEGVIGFRRRAGQLEFLVKWQGYNYTENTFEGLENLRPAKSLIYGYIEDEQLESLVQEVKSFYGDA